MNCWSWGTKLVGRCRGGKKEENKGRAKKEKKSTGEQVMVQKDRPTTGRLRRKRKGVQVFPRTSDKKPMSEYQSGVPKASPKWWREGKF